MPVYHSSFNALSDAPTLANLAVLPLKLKQRSPGSIAPQAADPTADDPIDEALNVFRANCLFRNFEIQGPADRVLIYLILFISDCLTKVPPKGTRDDAAKVLTVLAIGQFAIPGDGNFPLNQLYAAPESRAEADNLRTYLTQLRQETAARLLDRLYADDPTKPSKWWMAFSKRKFMNKSL
ncbi:actin-related protein 2/3 complex subunit 3 [Blastocladiella britannica]|nr:actin-related protein 2/3 complex subunit 3 [Blastocladiella britannica]